MRPLLVRTLLCGVAVAGVAALPACKTDQPGVKSTYRSQYTTVSGNTTKVTKVARDVLDDLKLQKIDSKSTAVDGWATGYTADNKKITVDIKRVSDNTSDVWVNVGSMGDPDMGKDILARMQKKLS